MNGMFELLLTILEHSGSEMLGWMSATFRKIALRVGSL